MTEKRLYLDHAATTPLLPEARAAMDAGFTIWANPSSPHGAGREARAALEESREKVHELLGWEGEVIFTSGASEALALAISGSKQALAAVSAIEHDAVLRHAKGAESVPVDPDCRIDPHACSFSGLVAVQHVNNETGTIQAIDKIADVVREAGGTLLADCAQSACKIALPEADMIAIAAHKFGGPIGIGALLVRDLAMLEPVGGQEWGYRAGTENLPLVLAMAAALQAGDDWLVKAHEQRGSLEEAILAGGGEVIAADAQRIATIGAYRMPGVSAASQLIRFDAQGICVSAGSACSSGSLKTSHVLGAMGMDETAASEVIRVSIGRETTDADIARFVSAWQAMAEGRAAA